MKIRLATDRFALRSLRARDVSQKWVDWLNDPEILEHLNSKSHNLTIETLTKQMSKWDDHKRYQIGIFEADTRQHIGNGEVGVNRQHKVFSINMMIGEKDWWGKGVVLEVRAAILDHFFFTEMMEKATGNPLAGNIPMIFNYKKQGWKLEGVLLQHLLSVNSAERLDQYQFALLREEWAEARKAHSDAG